MIILTPFLCHNFSPFISIAIIIEYISKKSKEKAPLFQRARFRKRAFIA